jgi:tetratricopeptide (TPR) repeat protein
MLRLLASVLVGLWLNPAVAQTAYQTAVSHVQQGRNDLAIPELEKLVASSPNDLRARNLLGIALLNSGRRADAVAQFQRAIAIDASFYPAIKNLAAAELAMGKTAAARAHFEQVLKLAPGDAATHFQLAELDYAEKRYAEAAAHYQRSGDLLQKTSGATLRAMRASLNARDPAAAIRIGEQSSRSVEMVTALAQAYEQSGDTQRAYDALRSATQLEPRNEAPYLDLMSLCLDHHTWDLALEVSAVALGNLPQSWRVRLERGAVLALKGDLAAAETSFLDAARIAPQEPLPQVSLALARVQLGRVPEAIEGLRASRVRNPRDYATNWILGETLAQQADAEDEAISVLEDAARLGPREAAPKVLLGKLFARRGDLPRAARELEAALRIEPDSVTAQYQLATVYRKAGDTARAEKLFAKVGQARTEDPEESARHNLEQIIRKSSR